MAKLIEDPRNARSRRTREALLGATRVLHAWARHLAGYHARLIAVERAIQCVRRADADAARHREKVTHAQLANCQMLACRLEREGLLAPQWTAETAADMLFALIPTDVIERLLVDRAWPRRRLEEHLAALFHATFVRQERSE
jgi:hypothetical protein